LHRNDWDVLIAHFLGVVSYSAFISHLQDIFRHTFEPKTLEINVL
jgi:hypothetical protein